MLEPIVHSKNETGKQKGFTLNDSKHVVRLVTIFHQHQGRIGVRELTNAWHRPFKGEPTPIDVHTDDLIAAVVTLCQGRRLHLEEEVYIFTR